MKSKRKDVLVKNVGVGPTLYQTPQGAPSFMDLWNAGVKGQGTSGNPVGMGGRLAGLAGIAGKGLAGLQTVNQVAQQAQAGNPLNAALGAGYTFEANDPTGTRTATAIQGQAPPTPSVEEQRANVPTVPLPNVTQNVALPNQSTQAPAPQAPAPQAPTPQAPAPMYQMGSDGIPVAVSPPMAEKMRQRQDEMKAQGRGPPAPVAVSPVLGDTNAKVNALNAKVNAMSQYRRPELQPQPLPSQLMQQPVQQMAQPVEQMAQPVAPIEQSTVQTTLNPFPQEQNPQVQNTNEAEDPFTHNLLQQQAHEDELMNNKAEFFASTLMEKLGADTVYKMNPHQIAMVSAYTFLKLS